MSSKNLHKDIVIIELNSQNPKFGMYISENIVPVGSSGKLTIFLKRVLIWSSSHFDNWNSHFPRHNNPMIIFNYWDTSVNRSETILEG